MNREIFEENERKGGEGEREEERGGEGGVGRGGGRDTYTLKR